jgi:2-keto-3-deoxy-L-rhamnonate aldolase RhmA
MCAEMMSSMGFDYFVLDNEHSPLDMLHIQTLMQAFRPDSKTCPIIRPWWNDMVAIKRALDIGAQGLLIPWINTAEQAKAAVSYSRYGPKGLRGCGPRRAAMFDPDYLTTADKEIFIAVQIETVEAVKNIDAICSVEGVDCAYIGPGDLSASLGHIGNFAAKDEQDAIDKVYDACKAHGVAAGIHEGSGKSLRERIDKGYNMVTLGNDLVYMKMGVQNQFKELGIKKK